jgi:nucleosome binding factor SPN SPT16 subunit
MKNRLFAFPIAAVAFIFLGAQFLTAPAYADTVKIMSIESLAQMLDNPNVVILDVRTGRDWKSSTKKIIGALRADPGNFSGWSTTYAKDKTIVLYCA